jgi:hypothetical protein
MLNLEEIYFFGILVSALPEIKKFIIAECLFGVYFFFFFAPFLLSLCFYVSPRTRYINIMYFLIAFLIQILFSFLVIYSIKRLIELERTFLITQRFYFKLPSLPFLARISC